MSPKNEVVKNGNTLLVQKPSKENMPKSNDEAMSRFGDALNVLLKKFNEAEKGSDVKKVLRRKIRSLGYRLADNRQRGVLVIEL